MIGAYITIGILITVLLLVGLSILQPRLRKYRLILKRVEPRKKRRVKSAKKRKSVWLRIV
jgi:hypothetical protein